MEVVLDLYNFDSADADGSKYVLTSPRSLEACSRMKVKPVELLQKSHADFSQENAGKSLELIQALYNEWEEKRMSLLQKCRHEREKIIMEQQVAKKKEKRRNANHDDYKFEKKLNAVQRRKPTRSIFQSSLLIDDSPCSDLKEHDSTNFENSGIVTPLSRNLYVNQSDGLRSRSVERDIRKRNFKLSNTSPRSLSVFGSKSTRSSGYITPQIQRDRRLVALMKERREQDEKEEKERRSIMLGWSKEQKLFEEAKRKETLQRQRELANSHLAWEQKLKEEDLKKQQKMRSLEEERLLKQEQSEALARISVEKQERLRRNIIEERKKIASEKKQKQEKSLNLVNAETMAHQKAVEEELIAKQDRALKMKLESEMRELQKVKFMNKKQQERIIEIQAELKRKQELDERIKRDNLGKKLKKAAENYSRKVVSRNQRIQNQGRQINEKIDQTQKNLKRIDREVEEHKQLIVDQKNERIHKAAGVAQETAQHKSIRAKEIRTNSELEWKKNLQLIRKKDRELIEQMKESLEIKDDKVKRHVQLKEAALEFSRVQAKINEAERESLKRKTTNFHQMAQKAKITADVGRGPRSSFVNYSTVKLG